MFAGPLLSAPKKVICGRLTESPLPDFPEQNDVPDDLFRGVK